jgi:hypothetical protein
MSPTGTFKGIVRGNSIELERPVGLPDGQEVTVVVSPTNGAGKPPPGAAEPADRAARLLSALNAGRNVQPIGTFTRADLYDRDVLR